MCKHKKKCPHYDKESETCTTGGNYCGVFRKLNK